MAFVKPSSYIQIVYGMTDIVVVVAAAVGGGGGGDGGFAIFLYLMSLLL